MTSDSALNQAIASVDAARTSAELMQATAALVRCNDLRSIPKLLEVIGFNNPALAGVALSGLVALGPEAAPQILDRLDPQNYGARAWAVRALAEIADGCALDTLVEALGNDIGPSVRRAAAKGLGHLKLMGNPDEINSQRQRCLQALSHGCQDGEWVVRYSCCASLERLLSTGEAELQAIQCLRERTGTSERVKVVRLRAALALQRLNAG